MGGRTAIAAAGCATGMGEAAARSICSSMSPLVTRPSLPVPAMERREKDNQTRGRQGGEIVLTEE